MKPKFAIWGLSSFNLWCIIALLVCQLSYAQTDTLPRTGRYRLSATPSAILNVTPALQVEHELFLSEHVIFSLRTGFIFSHAFSETATIGYRLRPALKFSIGRYHNTDHRLLLFYNYRRFSTQLEEFVDRAGGIYEERISGTRESVHKGFGVGYELEILDPNRWVTIGFGLGRGNIVNEYSHPELEQGLFLSFPFQRAGENNLPIFYFSVGIGLFQKAFKS